MKILDLIADVLAAPLDDTWSIDQVAEHLLQEIAVADTPEYELRVNKSTDLQSRRLIRPLLACLATKSAAENGSDGNVFVGDLIFRRPGASGLVEIRGNFRNMQGDVFASFRREPINRHGATSDPQAAPIDGIPGVERPQNPAVLASPACENVSNSK